MDSQKKIDDIYNAYFLVFIFVNMDKEISMIIAAKTDKKLNGKFTKFTSYMKNVNCVSPKFNKK